MKVVPVRSGPRGSCDTDYQRRQSDKKSPSRQTSPNSPARFRSASRKALADWFRQDQRTHDTQKLLIAGMYQSQVNEAQKHDQPDRRQSDAPRQAKRQAAQDDKLKWLKFREIGRLPLPDPGEALHAHEMKRKQQAGEQIRVDQRHQPGSADEPAPSKENRAPGATVQQGLDHEGAQAAAAQA